MTGPILVQNIIVNDKIIIIKSFFFVPICYYEKYYRRTKFWVQFKCVVLYL